MQSIISMSHQSHHKGRIPKNIQFMNTIPAHDKKLIVLIK